MEILDFCTRFLEKYYPGAGEMLKLSGKAYLVIDFSNIIEFDSDMADYAIDHFSEFYDSMKFAVAYDVESHKGPEVCFRNLPKSTYTYVKNIRSRQFNKLISVEGIIKSSTKVSPRVWKIIAACPNCGQEITVLQDERQIKVPSRCGCGRKGKFVVKQKEYIDVQKLEIEELPERMIESTYSTNKVRVYLEGALTDPTLTRVVQPGNHIILSGHLMELPKFFLTVDDDTTIKDSIIKVNYIEVVETAYEEVTLSDDDVSKIKEMGKDPDIIDKLTASIAPTIYGLSEVKEAILLQQFGGVKKLRPDGTISRSIFHILLIGDPSCLVANERVFLSDGTSLRIGNMGEWHNQDIKYHVWTGRQHISDWTSKFFKYVKQPIIEIITESGKSIKGTYNQPIMTKSGWKRMDELSEIDEVRAVSFIRCPKTALVSPGWEAIKRDPRRREIKIPEYIDEDVAAIVGYILADGWVSKSKLGFIINDDEKDILPILISKLSAKFGVKVHHFKKWAGDSAKAESYEIDSTHLAEILKDIRGGLTPEYILQSKNSVVAAYLRWLFEGDGCVFSKGRGNTGVCLKSSNIELLRDIQTLLLRWGIHARIIWEEHPNIPEIRGRPIMTSGSGNLMIRRGDSITRFAKEIGFVSEKKRKRMEIAVKYVATHSRVYHRKRVERIVKVNKLEPQDVFDIELPRAHQFVANGIVVHNSGKSKLLEYMKNVAPRARLAVGSGTTRAGITAAIVKDQMTGTYALEAGALVLAHKGLMLLDEADKMSPEDSSALHEAMETGKVTRNGAGISATLPAEANILAAANPKFGRFDTNESLAKQIEMPISLLSRFDAIFPVRDIPNMDNDSKIAGHILKSHKEPEQIVSQIQPDMIKKYIAYARRLEPKLLDQAVQEIHNFYVNLRAKSTYMEGGSVMTIPITPRQLEAIIRISEASAKARLSDIVEDIDVARAKRLIWYYLTQLGMTESGNIDIDKIQSSIAASERTKAVIIREMIVEMEKALGVKLIPLTDIVREAEVKGISASETEAIIDKLRQIGDIIEPKRGYIQRL